LNIVFLPGFPHIGRTIVLAAATFNCAGRLILRGGVPAGLLDKGKTRIEFAPSFASFGGNYCCLA
jgi:hypothetical protein